MKIFKILTSWLLIILAFTLAACSNQPQPQVIHDQVIVHDVTQANVAVRCEMPKAIPECESFTGTGFIPTTLLLKCVAAQKHVINICRDKENNISNSN